jgi:DNA-binding transcriptional LysR family regulator
LFALVFGSANCIVRVKAPWPEAAPWRCAIGIDPKDPYGSIAVSLFQRAGVDYRIAIKARFGTTVCRLVRHNLGIAIIDGFTVAHASMRGIRVIAISESTAFQTFMAYRRDVTLTTAAEFFIRNLRHRMKVLAPQPRVVG